MIIPVTWIQADIHTSMWLLSVQNCNTTQRLYQWRYYRQTYTLTCDDFISPKSVTQHNIVIIPVTWIQADIHTSMWRLSFENCNTTQRLYQWRYYRQTYTLTCDDVYPSKTVTQQSYYTSAITTRIHTHTNMWRYLSIQTATQHNACNYYTSVITAHRHTH